VKAIFCARLNDSSLLSHPMMSVEWMAQRPIVISSQLPVVSSTDPCGKEAARMGTRLRDKCGTVDILVSHPNRDEATVRMRHPDS